MDIDERKRNARIVLRQEDFIEIHHGARRLVGWHVGAFGAISLDVSTEGTGEVLSRVSGTPNPYL